MTKKKKKEYDPYDYSDIVKQMDKSFARMVLDTQHDKNKPL